MLMLRLGKKDIFKKSSASLQIYNLLQLSRKERECRAQCLYAKRKLDEWKKSSRKLSYPHLKIYAHMEGILLRRHAQDAAMLYRLVRKDRIAAFGEYVQNLPIRTGICGGAR